MKTSKILLCALLSACVWISGCASKEPDKEIQKLQEENVIEEPLREDGVKDSEKPQQEDSAEEVDSEEAGSGSLSWKTLSIMGDSISTYAGWTPAGYYDYYPENGEVEDVGQTWWKMVLDDMDMTLCANASSSGSTCIGDSTGMDNPQHGCSDFRISDLMGEDGTYPDVIIVYMGTNDFLTSVPLGDNDGTQYVEEGEVDNFSDAYSLMLDKLAAHYPGAEVFCCNLAPIGEWGTERPFETFTNALGLMSEDYSRQIEKIAATKGCHLIDLHSCGITIDNMQQYVSDGVHLNPEGMQLIRDAVEKAMTNQG